MFGGLSRPYSPAFEMSTQIYSVNLRNQYQRGRMRTRRNSDTFHSVKWCDKSLDSNSLSIEIVKRFRGSFFFKKMQWIRIFSNLDCFQQAPTQYETQQVMFAILKDFQVKPDSRVLRNNLRYCERDNTISSGDTVHI